MLSFRAIIFLYDLYDQAAVTFSSLLISPVMTAAVELKLAKIRARGDVMTFGTGAAFSSAVGDLDVHNPCSYFNQYVMNYFVRRASERPLTFRRSRLCDSVVPAHESIR